MNRHDLELQRLTRWSLMALAAWTAVVGMSLAATARDFRNEAVTLARSTARAILMKDEAFRLWASRKGGLYAGIDDGADPAPYMAHVAGSKVTADTGQRLALMNPASMLREMMEQYGDLYGVKGRIVGIVAINPGNRADPWEAGAIRAFEAGRSEVDEIATIDDAPHLRMIRPMVMQEHCVKCHGHLGFKVGDIRGAVAVNVPLAAYYASADKQASQATLFHGGIWLFGLLGGGLFFSSQRRGIRSLLGAEEALRQSESRYREAQTTARLGHWSYDVRARTFLWWSEETFRLLGIDSAGGHPSYRDFIERVHGEDRDRVNRVVEQCVVESTPFVVGYRVPLADGSLRHLEARGVAHADAAGVVTRLSGTVMDVSDARRAEAELQAAKRQLESIIDFLPDGTFVVDTEGRVVTWNRTMERMSGVAKHEIVGHGDQAHSRAFYGSRRPMLVDLILDPRRQDADNQRMQRRGDVLVAEGETPEVYGGRGGYLWATAQPLRDPAGALIGAIECVRDITDRRKAEQRLRLTQLSVDEGSDAVFWFGRDGCFFYVNEQASRMTGYSRDELAGLGIADVDAQLDAADIGPLVIRPLLEDGELRLESKVRRKDGSVIPVDVTARHMVFDGDEYMVAYVRDITAAKTAEAALRAEKQFSDTVINSLPGLFYLYDDNTRLVRCNDNLMRVAGRSREQLIGLPATDLIAESDRDRVARAMRAVMRDGTAFVEARLLTAGGEAIPHYFTGLRMHVGERDYLVGMGIDLSQLRRTEAALRLTRFAMESSADAIYLLDPDSRFIDANEAGCTALGCDRATLLTMDVTDINPDVTPEQLAQMFAQLRAAGRNMVTARHRRRDGTLFPVEVMANYLQFDGKEYNCCFVRDISERRRAEATLHLTRRAIDDAAMAFEWYDDRGRIVDVNRRSCFDLGYRRDELIGMHLADIDPDYPPERWAEIWGTIRRNGSITAESRHRRKDGSLFPVMVTGNYIELDGREYVFSYAQDITARRHAEAMLRLTQQAVDSSSIAFQWLDPEGRVVGCNPRAYESLGMSRAEFIGLHIWDFDPDFSPEKLKHAWTAMRGGPVTLESRHRRKDGTTFPVQISTNIVEFEGREYSYAYVTDISERKAAEQALRQLNLTLEARIQDEVGKNREKDHLLIQQSRLAAMGEMIGNIAHQWRQPINALSLVLANIKDAYEFGELDRTYLGDQVARGNQLVHKMSTTIDDFRNFFRRDRVRQLFPLAEAVRNAANVLEPGLAVAGITLDMDTDGDAQCLGFANEYAQVVLNLLANARQAIVENDVADGHIAVSIEHDGLEARTTVRDNGGGIPEEVLPKIFDPYFTTREKGSGIGLYMSKMIMDNMGGRIEAANAGDGACITVITPLPPAVADSRGGN